MTLMTALSAPAGCMAQQRFRRLLKALSEPGVIVSLSPFNQGWQPLSIATTGVLLTLGAEDTSVWLAPGLSNDIIRQNLRLYGDAPLVCTPAEAMLVVMDGHPDRSLLTQLTQRDSGVTLIVQVKALSGGRMLRLTGAGIAEERMIAPQLPTVLLDKLAFPPHATSLGFDLILTCGERLLAIPAHTLAELC